ncbi:MAG: 4-alpha-glucanotransferase, partial [Planctomycetes bacterium]|nr:4-alpha-glucanotransferase [Planctomycetota bacterium]
AAPAEWEIEVEEEGGETRRARGAAPAAAGELRLPLPAALPPGYHRLRLELRRGGAARRAEQALIVAPQACLLPEERFPGRAAGLWANLYSVRSGRNWGVGDLTDLEELVGLAARCGADFVGLNPLHAIRNGALERSPYNPVSRLFRSVLYLDVEQVPELAEVPELRERAASAEQRRLVEELRARPEIDYAAVRALKESFFAPLHRAFARLHRDAESARGQAYRRFLEEQGQPLDDYAAFLLLDAHFRERGAWWRSWPAEFRDPRSPAVAEFCARRFEEYDLHRYLQFELDRQFGAAAAAGARLGLRVGLYTDLAIGSIADGADAWANQGLFVHGVSLGAPPDGYSRTGQVWALPPLHPARLREQGYRYWIQLLRAAVRHAGALRIDHVIGLVRQFWVPDGCRGTDGALVRFPSEDLFGILALESHRAQALIVGEDLGTIPAELPPLMKEWGVLSSKVLLFERNEQGEFNAPGRYPRRALVTTSTHDHVPLPGFLAGADLPARRRLGLIESDEDLGRAAAGRREERRAIVSLLERQRLLAPGAAPSDADIVAGVHAFLGRTPCDLVGLSLDDLCGEALPVNIPGVAPERYPCWARKMSVPLADIAAGAVESALQAARRPRS